MTTDFAKQLTTFLTEYLPGQRNVSAHTVKAYRDTFVLFLRYWRDKRRGAPENLELKSIDAGVVLDFLDFLKQERHCGNGTRNHRLAALRSFFRYVQTEAPEHLMQCQRILAIRACRSERSYPLYLSADELTDLLAQPDQATRSGRRDVVLLSLLYDSGARVQEIIDVQVKDLRLDTPAHVYLTGKGRKKRLVPLMKRTVELLRAYMEERNLLDPRSHQDSLFTSRKGLKLSRFGVRYILDKHVNRLRAIRPGLSVRITPHTMRHSKAMHLLEANTPLVVIRDFLGHSDVNTTEIYARASLKMKREALEQAEDGSPKAPMSAAPWKNDRSLMEWLRSM